LWPNGWMDYDATWYGGRPWPRRLCSMGTQLPQRKGHSPHPICGPCLLWPNGWIDQGATWYGGKPRPTDVVLDGVSAPPVKGVQPPVFGSCLCGQAVGWMKTPFCTEVYLGTGHIVLDGVPAPPRKRHSSPLCWPMSTVAMVAHLSYC